MVGPTWAMAFAPTEAEIIRNRNGEKRTVNTTVDTRTGGNGVLAAFGAPIPVSLNLRQSFGSVVDTAIMLGPTYSGLELRAGIPDRKEFPLVVFSGSFSTGQVSLAKTDTYDGRLRVEVYPRLVESEASSTRLMIAAGLAGGRFVHFIPTGDTRENDIYISTLEEQIRRQELRLEFALGIERRARRESLSFAVMPWLLLASGHPEIRGTEWTLQSFTQGGGVSFVISAGAGGDLFARPTGGTNR